MGTFIGHAMPGSFFLIFAIWWTVRIIRRKFICSMKGVPFYNTAAYPCNFCCQSIPLESVVKIVATAIGIIGEGYASTEPIREDRVGRMNDFHGFYVGDIQHITIYSFFFLSGVCDIIATVKYGLIPAGIDYIAAALAFTAEGLLFKFHLFGRDPLDIAIHTLLVYVIFGCVLAVLVEYKFTNSIYAGLFRAYMVFLQGTWFFHAGFILYPPIYGLKQWDGHNHENVMFVTAMFTWHMVGVLIAMACISGITYCCTMRVCQVSPYSMEYRETGKHLTSDDDKIDDENEIYLQSASDDEEEIFS